MKKLIGCALLIAFCTAPAMAIDKWEDVDLTGVDRAIGFINPDTGELGAPFFDADSSETLTFQLGMYISPSLLPYYAESLTFSFAYDNTVMMVEDLRAIGSEWVSNNFEGQDFPNSSHDTIAVDGLQQAVGAGDYGVEFMRGEATAFAEIDLKLKNTAGDQAGAFGVVLSGFGVDEGYGLTLVSSIDTDYNLYPEDFSYYGGYMQKVPEPSAMLLLGGAVTGLVGISRRRK